MTAAHEAVETFSCDVLIIGSGGAGLMAALHAYDTNPALNVVVVAKGLIGKSGCTRLVQGGFNAVLEAGDSIERHFVDTLEGGAYLNDQELAWALVSDAPEIIRKLETKAGVFFDRSPDGTIHQKAFAGQSFDRTVHRGDQTGIEIVSRLHDQLLVRNIGRMDETRAIDLIPDASGTRIAGALLLEQRTGRFVLGRARVTLLATGGGPRMYTYSAPSLEKVGDGYAMAYRAGCELIDMEMMQFHPTGILAGASRLSGMVLEEGLRGAGAFLLNGEGERFMERYDPVRKERATRDVVSRAGYLEIMAGRGSPQGGVFLDASHLGAAPRSATISRASRSRSCRRRTFTWAARESTRTRASTASTACSWPAKTRAACTARIVSVETAWPSRACSALERVSLQRRCAPDES